MTATTYSWNDGLVDDRRAARRRGALARTAALAWLLDKALVLPGTRFRFGLDGLLGLVPGVGDAVTTTMALWLVYEAYRVEAPRGVIARMLANIALDTAVGSIPVVGDLFDLTFKANMRNLELLRRHLDGGG